MYCRMLQECFIKLPFVFKTSVLSFLGGCLRQALLYLPFNNMICYCVFFQIGSQCSRTVPLKTTLPTITTRHS